ncbi:uncharacterized protein VTP21DRAFT_6319 [Calcarisporiella thermophila]|uniref:uncharacterized protein n=1 Tax=Calcarisporiella thermophila TaxID=911321 RepID=UPI003744B151
MMSKALVSHRRQSFYELLSNQMIWLITLPINFIPIVGQAAFIYINGMAKAGSMHKKYFDIKQMTDEQRLNFLTEHYTEYRNFGMVATILELVPFVNFFFRLTNAIGAALWARDIEGSISK